MTFLVAFVAGVLGTVVTLAVALAWLFFVLARIDQRSDRYRGDWE